MEEQTASDPVGCCPHCENEIVPELKPLQLTETGTGNYTTGVVVCPECSVIIGATESKESL